MGGAMLAMVASGEYESVKEAAQRLTSVSKVIKPTPELAEKYENKYRKFKKIYPACKSLFAELK